VESIQDAPKPVGRLETFFVRPLSVALALAKGECGGTYVEACMLVSSVISGVASFVWPGEDRVDHKRFVEAWTHFAGDPKALISQPLLLADLRKRGRLAEAMALAEAQPLLAGGHALNARVLTGADVDIPAAEVHRLCPALDLKEIREFSYPVIFYRRVRSALTHEYGLGEGVTHYGMTARDEGVSYTNHLGSVVGIDEDGKYVFSEKRERRIFFWIAWLVEVARSIARGADQELAKGPVSRPAKWWIQG
jgi:hypothetical protein